ncbi:hypothetical protein H5T88_08860 [bacterium]|nr:hypothetical protein [bacterium]
MRLFKKLSPCLIASILLVGATPPSKMGPLRVSKTNPRYFEDSSGKIVYLTGSHTWTNLQDGDERKPPFDFNAYIRFLVKHNHNFIRMWSWQSTGAWIFPSISPHPWLRTGPGLANDGKPKFNLKKFNPDYFKRLRERVELAREKGIYVSVMLFVGGNFEVPGEWKLHPFNKDNNVNGIDGDVDGDGRGSECVTLSEHPKIKAVREIELAYIRKVIDTLNDLDNVLYEIINEGGTKEWDWFIVNYIKEYEKKKPKQHPVGLTGHGRESNDDMLASPADWFSPGSAHWGDLRTNPRAMDGKKVSILDTDHIWGEGGNYQWVWKSFLRGHNPIFMDRIASLTGNERGDIPGSEEIRQAMGQTLRVAKRINLAKMIPHNELSSTSYCLADPGNEYLVYFPEMKEGQVDLSGIKATFKVEWFHPLRRIVRQGGKVEGGGKLKFTPPFREGAALHLIRE